LRRISQAPGLLDHKQMSARILIVEDNPATRLGMVDLLSRAGYDVSSSATFDHARVTIRDHRPDLLITDVRLGDYNGLQLIIGTRDPVPTIVVSAYDDPVLEAEARAQNAPYLLKPVTPTVLLQTIEQVIAREQGVLSPTRRWSRKRVTQMLPAHAEGAPARILDVSYGGLRVELDRDLDVPPSFTIRVQELALPVDVVWRSRKGDDGWIFGLSLAHIESPDADRWHGLVDTIE
jgi:CheY-like chemotaxis protein